MDRDMNGSDHLNYLWLKDKQSASRISSPFFGWNRNIPGPLGQYPSCWLTVPYVARLITATVSIMQNKRIIVFREDDFQLPVPPQC